MKKQLFISLFIVLAYINLFGSPVSKNTLTILNQSFSVNRNASHRSFNLSYVFVDLKFDGTNVKICEIGPAVQAGIRPTEVWINNKKESLAAPFWGLFWHHLSKFKLPMWCVGRSLAIEQDQLERFNGAHVPNFTALQENEKFQQYEKKAVTKSNSLSDYKGIILFTGAQEKGTCKAFKQHHPDYLYVNDVIHPIISFKGKVTPIYQRPEIAPFKPRCKMYPKKYTPDLAQTIVSDIKAPFLIIKPHGSLQSRGILMVESENLDALLKLILQDKDELAKQTHRNYKYWTKDGNASFIVEEYVPSKTAYVNGKAYDPTFRLVAFLTAENKKLTATIVGGYWKVPLKSLDDKATLTEQHITIPNSGCEFTGKCIEPDDFKLIAQQLAPVLLNVYAALLDG